MTKNRFKMEFIDTSHDEVNEKYSFYRAVESCISDDGEFMSYGEIETTLNKLNDENKQLIKDNFELQGLLGDVRALLRLDKVDDAISRIDKFERSMKK